MTNDSIPEHFPMLSWFKGKESTRRIIQSIMPYLIKDRLGGPIPSGTARPDWWVAKLTIYHGHEPVRSFDRRSRIFKGLPSDLTPHERKLIMAGVLHDRMDTNHHTSKLGCPITISDPYVQWLCEHHHSLKEYPPNRELQLMQTADSQTSRYAWCLAIPTAHRKLVPVNTRQLARQLESATTCSIYQLDSIIYHSQELNSLTASKAQPTESRRNHLIGVANWVLFLLRTPTVTSVALTGEPGGTPGPVEVEDPRITDEP